MLTDAVMELISKKGLGHDAIMISFTKLEVGDAGLIMTLNYHCFSHVAEIF